MARLTPRGRYAIVAAAVFAALLLFGALRPITDPIVSALAAAAGRLHGFGVAVANGLASADDAEGRSRGELEEDVVALRIENAKLRDLALENEALKTALSFREREKSPMLLARVLSETDDDVFHGVVLDRGSDDGVATGQAVVVGDGIVIGKVLEVRRRTSSVMLLADSKSRLAVAVQNGSDTIGVLAGDRGLSMAIDLIPQGVKVGPGDIVVTSGIEPGIGRGLIIGTVEKVSTHSQDPFQTATVAPMAGALRPVFVHIITGTAQ